jgi:hypothetical protein
MKSPRTPRPLAEPTPLGETAVSACAASAACCADAFSTWSWRGEGASWSNRCFHDSSASCVSNSRPIFKLLSYIRIFGLQIRPAQFDSGSRLQEFLRSRRIPNASVSEAFCFPCLDPRELSELRCGSETGWQTHARIAQAPRLRLSDIPTSTASRRVLSQALMKRAATAMLTM